MAFTSSVTVTGNGAYTSSAFTPAAPGIYRWRAEYSGDASNNPASGSCNAPHESVEVGPFVPALCTQTLTGNVTGPFTVAAGQTLCVTKARVIGPITVNAGGSLSVSESQVTQGIAATSPALFSLCGSSVSGPSGIPGPGVKVTDASGPLRIGDAPSCAPNRVVGDVILTGNKEGLTLGANIVHGNVTVDDNTGATVIKANTISKTLVCSANDTAPTNAGQSNTAATKSGQCAAL